MGGFKKITTIVVKAANIICVACIAIMLVTVVADVLMRFVFSRPLQGVTELAQCCWVLMSLSFGYVALINGHTKVDIFVNKMKPVLSRIMILATNICAVFFCILVAWKTIGKAMSSMSTNNMYVMLGIKEWPIILLFAFSFIIAALACVLVMMEE